MGIDEVHTASYILSMNTMTALEKFEAAQKMIRDGEARNLSESTMRKRWRAYFSAEDALKAIGGWL
jgi:hypothetical protein